MVYIGTYLYLFICIVHTVLIMYIDRNWSVLECIYVHSIIKFEFPVFPNEVKPSTDCLTRRV